MPDFLGVDISCLNLDYKDAHRLSKNRWGSNMCAPSCPTKIWIIYTRTVGKSTEKFTPLRDVSLHLLIRSRQVALLLAYSTRHALTPRNDRTSSANDQRARCVSWSLFQSACRNFSMPFYPQNLSLIATTRCTKVRLVDKSTIEETLNVLPPDCLVLIVELVLWAVELHFF